ncbi:CAunnamed protein product [Biomphalaria glabrata]|nr:CAunnamed protein product [Biomphalaria glabrata]
MAANQALNIVLEEYTLPLPPEAANSSSGFQYRGRLFRPFSATYRPSDSNEQAVQSFSSNHLKKPPRAQSAKGRLEKQTNLTTSENSDYQDKRLQSVVNLNLVSDISSLNLTSHKSKNDSCKPKNAFKKSIKCIGDLDFSDTSKNPNLVQPCVQGVKVKQKVLEDKPAVQDVWINFVNPQPETIHNVKQELSDNKLNDNLANLALGTKLEDSENKKNLKSNEKKLPSTLRPLEPWLKHSTAIEVVGLEASKCWVFLSHDYESEDLPELPAPQSANQDLPYTCIVETPRKPVRKKYKHAVVNGDFEKEDKNHNHKRKENESSSISFIRNVLAQNGAREIVREIQELEDLMKGIVSKNSTCSFVQFQDEILKAKSLAARLTTKKHVSKASEKTDTFGLLKLYKDHDEIMKLLLRRRDHCLQDLAKLCADVEYV